MFMGLFIVSIYAEEDKTLIELKKKNKELSDLSKRIEDQELLIDVILNKIKQLGLVIAEKKKNQLISNSAKDLIGNDILENFRIEINQFKDSFFDLSNKYQLNIIKNNFLGNQFDKEYSLFKFYLIRAEFEVITLKILLVYWESLAKETRELYNQVESIHPIINN